MAPVILQNDLLSVRLMPERGGKLTSIKDRRIGFELLYQPAHGYPPLRPGMAFSDGDASGYDDVFPSMGEIYSGALWPEALELPDHGCLWTSPMELTEHTGEIAVMRTEGTLLPYQYEKRLTLRDSSVDIDILIRNSGTRPLPLVWVCHCLMRLEPDTSFDFPRECVTAECIPGCGYPTDDLLLLDMDDPRYEVRTQPPAGRMMKYYCREHVVHGVCGVTYPSCHARAELRFDTASLPWLGFWITTGGYRNERNFAFEPATAWYDTWSKAEASKRLPMLAPGKAAHLSLGISLSVFG